MLRRAKIVLVDEPSSNIDEKMEQLITEALNKTFAQCTVLTIAHKIKTIMASDKIMVVDKGEVAEFDTPKNLLENPKSNFFKIVKMIEE
jgi:ABC-type multidrug transport system fused ATPase/permease subunit